MTNDRLYYDGMQEQYFFSRGSDWRLVIAACTIVMVHLLFVPTVDAAVVVIFALLRLYRWNFVSGPAVSVVQERRCQLCRHRD